MGTVVVDAAPAAAGAGGGAAKNLPRLGGGGAEVVLSPVVFDGSISGIDCTLLRCSASVLCDFVAVMVILNRQMNQTRHNKIRGTS